MEIRYKMTDILPLLPIQQPPYGKSSYNIPCPICDHSGSKEKHLNINLKRNVFRCPKCGQFSGGVFDLYAYYMGIPRDQVLEDVSAKLDGRPGQYPVSKNRVESPPVIPQAKLASLEDRSKVCLLYTSRCV